MIRNSSRQLSLFGRQGEKFKHKNEITERSVLLEIYCCFAVFKLKAYGSCTTIFSEVFSVSNMPLNAHLKRVFQVCKKRCFPS